MTNFPHCIGLQLVRMQRTGHAPSHLRSQTGTARSHFVPGSRLRVLFNGYSIKTLAPVGAFGEAESFQQCNIPFVIS